MPRTIRYTIFPKPDPKAQNIAFVPGGNVFSSLDSAFQDEHKHQRPHVAFMKSALCSTETITHFDSEVPTYDESNADYDLSSFPTPPSSPLSPSFAVSSVTASIILEEPELPEVPQIGDDNNDAKEQEAVQEEIEPPVRPPPPPPASEPMEDTFEPPPAYTCGVQLSGVIRLKPEIENTNRRAAKRTWRTRFVELRGTALHVYKVVHRVHLPFGGGSPRTSLISSSPIPYSRTDAIITDLVGYDDSAPSPTIGRRTMLGRTKAKQKSWVPPVLVRGELERSYTLLHADAGVAVDYRKRPHVLRIRAETDQFLMACDGSSGLVAWLDALFAAINIAPAIEERDFPRDATRLSRGSLGSNSVNRAGSQASARISHQQSSQRRDHARIREPLGSNGPRSALGTTTVTTCYATSGAASGRSPPATSVLSRASLRRRRMSANLRERTESIIATLPSWPDEVAARRCEREMAAASVSPTCHSSQAKQHFSSISTSSMSSSNRCTTPHHIRDHLVAPHGYAALRFAGPRRSSYIADSSPGDGREVIQWQVDWATGHRARVAPPEYAG